MGRELSREAIDVNRRQRLKKTGQTRHKRLPFDGARTPGYPKPWLSEKNLGRRFFRSIVLS